MIGGFRGQGLSAAGQSTATWSPSWWVSRSQAGLDPQPAAVVTHRRGPWPRKRSRIGSGAAIDQAEQLPLGISGGLRLRSAARPATPTGTDGPRPAGAYRAGSSQRFAGGPDRVEWVGLRPVATLGPFRPVELDHHLVAISQVTGQASAMAAGALRSPTPADTAWASANSYQLGVATGRRLTLI